MVKWKKENKTAFYTYIFFLAKSSWNMV